MGGLNYEQRLNHNRRGKLRRRVFLVTPSGNGKVTEMLSFITSCGWM